MRQILRALLALLSAAAWIPPLIVLVMGWFYLSQLFQFLLAPGIPVSLRYPTEEGKALVSVQSYSIDLEERRATFFGLEVTDPKGRKTLTLNKAEAWQVGPAIHVRGDRAWVRLERLSSGGLDLGGVLPKTQEGGEFGLRASLQEIRIDYLDRVVNKRHQGLVTGLTLEQGDSDTILAAQVSIDGAEKSRIALHSGPKGRALLQADLARTEAAPLLAALKSWLPKEALEGWEKLEAESLIAEGDLLLTLADKKAPDIRAEFDFEAVNATLPGTFRNWTGEGRGRMDEGVAAVTAEIRRSGNKLTFEGGATLSPLRAAGKFRLVSRSSRDLWPEIAGILPKGASYRGAFFDGILLWDKDVQVNGSLVADEAAFGADRIRSLTSRLAYNGKRLTAIVSRGTAFGRPVTGWVDWLPKPDQLAAWVDSPTGPLQELVARAGQKGLVGEGMIQGLVTGSSAQPVVRARASASGRYTFAPDQRPITISQGDFRAEVTKDGLALQRAAVLTPSGIVSAAGGMTWKGGLDFLVEGSGVRLASYVDGVEGTGFFQGRVSGTTAAPLFQGEAEAYDLVAAGQSLAWLKAQVGYGPTGLQAAQVRGQVGGGSLFGQAGWDPKSGALTGSFEANNLLLSDWAPDGVFGAFDVKRGEISGTIQNPLVRADLMAGRTLAYGVKADSLSARLQANKDEAKIEDLVVLAGEGRARGGATYNLSTTAIGGRVEFEDLPLSRVPLAPEVGLLAGTATGSATLSGSLNEAPVVELETGLSNLEVNATRIGSGQARARLVGSQITASGEVGSLERFLSIPNFQADLEAKTISAKADLLNFELQSLIKAGEPSWSTQPPRVQEALRSIEGDVSASMEVSGALNNPDLRLNSLQASNLKALGRGAGELKAVGAKAGDRWNLDSLTWTSDDMRLSTSRAVYHVDSGVDVALNLDNFDLTWLSLISPEFPAVTGKASVTLVASGKPDNPDVQASIFAASGSLDTGEGPDVELFQALNLDTIEYSNRVISAGGTVRLRGFLGDIRARAPLAAFEEGKTDELDASLVLRRRPLSEFVAENTQEKPEIEGFVEGRAEFKGRPGEWRTSALVKAEGTKAKIPDVSTELGAFSLEANLLNKEITATGFAEGSRGGRVTLEGVKAVFPLLFEANRDLNEILETSQLAGKAVVDGLAISEPLAPNTQASSGTLTGEVTLGGTAAASRIGGFMRVLGANVIIPGAFPESAPGEPLPYEPRFNQFRLEAGPQTTIRFGLGFLQVQGTGVVDGRLSALNVQMPLTVQRGLLRLPNARIALQEGGSVDVNMQSTSGIPLQVLVDMEGQTNLTARRGADQYETYDVTLEFRGNLLNPEGLNISASADPSDLTSQEILGILGQRELVEALASSALQGGGASALRDPLYQIGLPSLTDPITARLADALKLDYLSLDYNPFDQAIVRFGKNLGAGFTVQGWRQLSEPQFGPLKYDLRVTWRPRLGGRDLNRVRIGLGTTHDRPYRLTIDWGRRW